jgi:hypothetical protein
MNNVLCAAREIREKARFPNDYASTDLITEVIQG